MRGISEREYERLLSTRLKGRRDGSFYRHGLVWLDSDHHYAETAKLKVEYQASRRGGEQDDITPEFTGG